MNKDNPMKHVVALNGSPKKSTTFTLLREIVAILEAQSILTTIVNIGDYDISECTGCELCIRQTTECYQNDGGKSILPQLLAADGIILASPVYVMNVSGKLKNLIDKTSSWVHRPPLAGKPALLAATTAGAGLKDVLNYLEKVTVQWGAHPTTRIGRSLKDNHPLELTDIEDFLWHLNHPPAMYTPSLNQVMQFSVQKALALNVLSNDSEYWVRKGWDKQHFYYPARISLYKRVVGWTFFRFMNRRVQETLQKNQPRIPSASAYN